MYRRTFIGTSIAASLMASRGLWAAEGSRKLDRIGMQLYTVRDLMKSDFEGTLAKVAGIGYNEVEFAGYFDHAPKDIRAILDK
ncbi:MAG: sugar phosphate isomerase/epimerase, partial [Candidatus Acidiferrum sp.]